MVEVLAAAPGVAEAVTAVRVSEVAAAWLFLTALFNMPIANATAILQVLPLTVTLAGALFLGEALGWRRLLAILVGLVGVMLIVQPGAEGFTIYSIYVVLAVAVITVRDLSTRRMSPQVSSLSVAAVGGRSSVAAVALTATSGAASSPIRAACASARPKCMGRF